VAREREVKVTVLGEDKGASKALHSVEQAAGKLGPTGDATNKIMGMLGSTLGSHLGPAGGIVEKGLRGLPDLFRQSTGEGLNMSSMLKGGLAGGAAAAGAALVAFALKGVGDFQKVTGEVRQLKNVMGATAEEASGLRNVAVMLGIDTDTMAKGMLKLSVNLEKTKGDFAGVHVETAKNADGTTNLVKTLDNVRAAYQSISDPQQKNIFLTESMSKAGVNLRGVMSLTNAEFERFKTSGAIITDKDLKMALEYSRSQREMGLAMQSLSVTAGRVIIPVLTEVSKTVADGTHWVEENTKKHTFWGNVMTGVWKNLSEGPPLLRSNAESHEEAAKAAEKHAAQGAVLKASMHELGIEISDDEERTGELTEANKKAKAAAEAYQKKIDDMARSVSSASAMMGRASGDLTEDQRKLARSFDESKTAADSLKQGLDILVGVHLSAAEASIRWQGAIAQTTEKLAENKATLDITTAAGRDNQSAIIDMVRAGLSHIDALQREGASSEEVTAAYGDHVAALRNVMHQAGYTDGQIEELLRHYGLLAAAPDINKTVSTKYVDTYVRTYTYLEGGHIPAYALGMEMGPVPGGRNEKVPILAHGGEWVVTPEQMANLTSGASGGAYMGGGSITLGPGSIIVYALDPKSAAMGVRDELVGYKRRVPELGL
jgi:hypothetical protein